MPPIVSAISLLVLAATADVGQSLPQPPVMPTPGKIEVFRDWAVGCDNGRQCRAISFAGESSSGFAEWGGPISILRTAGQDDILRVRVLVNSQVDEIDRYQMLVDGELVDTGPVADGDYPIEIVGEDAKKVALAIARGQELVVTDPNGETLTKVSLAGSAAALRYMDQRQERARTKTALVAKGSRNFEPMDTPIPVVPVERWSKSERIPATTEIVRLAENSPCKDERFGVVEDQAYPLGQKDGRYRALVLIACGSGAYNLSSSAYIGEIAGREADGARWRFRPAEFDVQPAWAGEGRPAMLVNAGWDEEEQLLGSFAKGRGLGDCGSAESYVWDGEKFRLIEASNMPECRGAYEWITTWRASYRMIETLAGEDTPSGE
ncbi:MAG: DUF1176 domain-containing protein [Pseudomonadota bacterium]